MKRQQSRNVVEANDSSRTNRKKSPETDSYKYGQIIFNQGTKAIQEKGWSFQQTVWEQLDMHTPKSKLQLILHILYKY